MPSIVPYRVACIQILSLYDSYKNNSSEYEERYIVAIIKEILHCTPAIPTGLASSEAAQLPIKKLSKDHFYGRTRSARTIIRYLELGIFSLEKIDRLEAFIKSRSRVHFVTQSQNKTLATRDRNPGHWSKLYEKSGIELVPYQGKTKFDKSNI